VQGGGTEKKYDGYQSIESVKAAKKNGVKGESTIDE
jgi:hypothetical protein